MIQVKRFDTSLSECWDQFVRESKNGLFLFERGFMDYHADRFVDHSLLFYSDDELLALLPANERDGVLNSHGGLTYGGFLLSKRASASFVLHAFDALMAYAREHSFRQILYKAIPYIFHQIPSGEDLYALFRAGAQLYRRDASSVIELSVKPVYTKGTKYNLSKSRKHGVRVEESRDFARFMQIEEELLRTKYGTRPTHTADEMVLLNNRFPAQVRLFLAWRESECLGGTIIFESPQVVHTQYIGITDAGKEVGALDAVTDHLLQLFQPTHRYFSFGISTVNEGKELNEGLIRNKESFGARTVTHDFYKIEL